MRRFPIRWALALVGLAPTVGCLTPNAAQTAFRPMTSVGGIAEGKEKTLPPKETVEILMTLAADLEKNGFIGDAITNLEKARETDPKLNLNHRLAVLYDQLGEERKALTEFDLALKHAPKDANLLNDYGYCHYNRGRWAEAEAKFRAAVAIKADHPRANTNLGLALAQQGKVDEALAAFQKVSRPAEAKANVAFVLASQGKKAEARAMYQESLRMEPALMVARQGMMALEKPATKPADGVTTAAASAPAPGNRPLPPASPTLGIREPEPDNSPIIIDPRSKAAN
ncbi:MAG: tetratricopeptide repeat protein [Gemmataceae bacterium]|nr:tetratricopeptide repeat protein [Gemmataceae bacterium]